MRVYPVPVQLNQEERIIGGRLTLRQLLYLVIGTVVGCGIALAVNLPIAVRLIIAIFGILIGMAFAFIPAGKTSLDIYLLRWFIWKVKKRRYFLGGDTD
ncbi:PrgI family protein [Desulfotomaculum nigrificans]|uniref:PrgI family protein n=1 Tax=Desulfotomaculum nigrificans TaxID=1565 RepID=UPI0001FAEB24|nr:PrgI family protein [Desulfotomaculum nigrificans]